MNGIKIKFSVIAILLLASTFARSSVVENLSGELVVQNGSPNYNFSLAVPPGINGLQPAISVSYAPGGSATNMGGGFSLQAGGAISRCTASIRKDGFFAGIEQSSNTRFCRGGDKLVLVTGSNAAAGSEYRSYLDNNVKFIANGGSQFTPESWTEKTSDGYTLTYSKLGQFNEQNAQWLLTSKTDLFGNTLNYIYSESGQPLVTEITYNGSQVDIEYENRQAPIKGFDRGVAANLDKRVKAVAIKFNGAEAWSYSFAYELVDSDSVNQERLQSITKCYGANGNSGCTNPLSFQYSPQPTNVSALDRPEDRTLVIPRSFYTNASFEDEAPWDRPSYSKADLNNDGFPEFCYYKVGTGVLCAEYSSGSYELPKAWSGDLGYVANTDNHDDYAYFSNLNFVDLNNDRFTDLCFIDDQGVRCALNQSGNSFGSFGYWNNALNSDSGVVFEKLTHDNKPEFCGLRASDNKYTCYENTGSSAASIYVQISDVISFEKSISWREEDYSEGNEVYSTKSREVSYKSPFWIDINSDLSRDLCWVDGSLALKCFTTSRNASDQKLAFSSEITVMNIVGLTGLPNPSSTHIYNISQSQAFKDQSDTAEKHAKLLKTSLRFADINGDGNADICYVDSTKAYKCHLNTGESIEDATTWADLTELPEDETLYNASLATLSFSDENYDGLVELCSLHSKYRWCASSNGTSFGEFNPVLSISPDFDYDQQTSRHYDNFIRSLFGMKTRYRVGVGSSSFGTPMITSDLNGDSSPEFCYRSIHGVLCTDLDNNTPTYALEGVTDSFGLQTNITYEMYLADGLYDSSLPVPAGLTKKLTEKQLVSTVSTNSGTYVDDVAITNSVQYRYGHHVIDTSTNSSGFSHLIVENTERNQKTISEMYIDSDLMNQEKHIKKYISGILVNETLNEVTKKTTAWDTVQTRVESVQETQYDLSGTKISQKDTTFDSYDDYGFVTKQTQLKTQAGEFLQTQSTNEFLNDTSNWLLGLPESNTVVHTDSNGSNVTRVVNFTYQNGMPKTETVAPGDEDQQVISYTYDLKGLPSKVETTANGETRYVDKEYDDFGRLTLMRNALGEEETYTYDRWCGVSTATDIAGRIKTTSYDDLCQKATESYSSDSNLISWEIDWSSDISRNLIGIPTQDRNPAVYKITETTAFGAETITHYDANGREIRVAKKANAPEGDVRYSLQDRIYDRYGRAIASTKPYFEINGSQSTPLWSYMEYDLIDRPLRETKNGPNGLPIIASFTYTADTTTQSYSDYSKVTVTGIHEKPVSITENDLVVSYKYNAIGDLLETNRDGQIITLEYDGRGQKSKQVDPSMGTWFYDYNGFGELIWQKDAKAQITTFSYDELGRQRTRVDADGTTTFNYNLSGNGIGQLANESSPSATRTYGYDTSGRVTSSELAIDSTTYTTTFTYDAYSRLLTTQHPDGLLVTNTYDAVGGLKTFSVPSSDFQDYDYVALKQEADALMETMAQLELQIYALEQTALGHTVKATYYRDQVSYFTRLYDSSNAQVDELETIAAAHDEQAVALYQQAADMRAQAAAVLEKIGDPSKTSMKYTGVKNGQYEFKNDWCTRRKRNWHGLSKRCVAREYRTIYLSKENLNPSDPANPIYLFNGTPSGRYHPNKVYEAAAKAWDELAKVQVEKAEAARDLLNGPDTVSVYMPKVEQHQTWVLIGVEIPVPVEVTVTTRDKQWQQVSLDTAIAYYEEQRDYYQGLLNSENLKHNTVVSDISRLAEDLLEAQNAFDLFADNMDALNLNTEDLAGIVDYREQWQSENKQLAIWMATDRNAAGQIKSELFGNGLFTRKEYNEDSGAVEAIVTGTYSGHVMRYLEYTYNDRGLIDSKSDTTTQGNYQYETFDYDTQGRLTGWQFDQTLTGATLTKVKNHTREYSYDDWGNITSKTGAGVMNYDASNGRLTSREIDGKTLVYSYDDNGNMLNGDGRTYTWNAFNKVASVSNGQTVNFAYDANQKRVSKRVGSAVTYYVSPGYEVTIEESGDIRHRHNLVVGNDVVATYERLESATETSDQVVYYHRDITGSGELVTGSGMEVIARRNYTPFGENLADVLQEDDSAVLADGAEAIVEVDENYKEQVLAQVQAEDTFTLMSEIQVRESERLKRLRGYTSHENVAEVGLINMNARLYDPVIARFISADTMVPGIDQPLAYNRYAYVNGNPVSYRDPSGHWIWVAVALFFYVDASIQDNEDYQMVANIGLAVALAHWAGPALGGGAQGAMAGAAVSSLSMSFLASGEITAEDVVNAGLAAAAAGITYGIGHEMGFAKNSWQQYAAHAINQGTFAHIRGGKFIHGAVAGLAGKAGGELTSSVDAIQGSSHVLTRTMIAGSMGWLAAKATDGDAADAFLAAATVHLFNAEGRFLAKVAKKFWTITPHGTKAALQAKDKRKYYQSKKDGTWWSKDTAGHGGSAWKVFEKRSDGLHWIKDADEYGNYILDKHKGDAGMFIPNKSLTATKIPNQAITTTIIIGVTILEAVDPTTYIMSGGSNYIDPSEVEQ